METLLQSLAMKYGMEKAIQLLGIDKQTQNPKYAISMGGNTLDIGNMAKRGLFNRGINAITSGGMLGPGLLLGGALGLGYLTNPLREGSFNYNPNLQGQIDYALNRGYIGTNSNSGLRQYSDDSILSGQNVVSLFGTNDYGKQLQKYKDKYYDTMSDKRRKQIDREIEDLTTDEFDQVDKFIAQQTPATPVKPNTYFNPNERDGGSTPSPSKNSQGMTSAQHSAFRMARGGIASL